MASQEPTLLTSKHSSNRVLLKSILERSDGGLGLVGQRLVIGGWVKSSKEVIKEVVNAPQQPPVDKSTESGSPTDVSCTEVLQSRIPILRSFFKIVWGSNYHVREKLESVAVPKPRPLSIAFLVVSDGSSVAGLQVVVDSSLHPPSELVPTGTCILAEGILRQPSVPGKHVVELQVEKLLHLGMVDQDKYLLSKKRLPIESLRDCTHFRARTTTVASVMRIRNALTLATHTFFQNHGFIHVQLPTITTTYSEGFSEKFIVTTHKGKASTKVQPRAPSEIEGISLDAVKAALKEKTKLVEELQRTDSNKEALFAATQDLRKTNELASRVEAREKSKSSPSLKDGEVNSSEDFFSQKTYLTVSGRLHLESYACSLGNVYSCGPRFRAEKIVSAKQSVEMWMVEIEIAFSQLEDAIDCADDFLKFLCKWVMDNCAEDMKFVLKRIDKTSIDRLQTTIASSFEKITYTEALNIFNKITDGKSEVKLEWGAALTDDHLSYLADKIYQKPVIVYNYPKELKPFYVRLNDDRKTVAAFDMVVPKGGPVISGSQNEERVDMLSTRIKELGLPREQYEWYLDLRRHGTAKHSGFSLSFDRLALFATGLTDIRDAIPFPRSSGKINS